MKQFQTKKALAAGLIMITLLTSWAMLHVWSRIYTTQLGYSLSQEQCVREKLISENKTLKLEISTLKSTQRLEYIAINKLGMKPPQRDQVVYLWTEKE